MNQNPIRTAIGLALMSLPLLAPAATSAAQTASARHAVDIPAGPLDAAITRLGRTLGVVVSIDASLVRSSRTPGLRGSFAPQQAFDALLAGSALRAIADGQGGFQIVAAPAPATASSVAVARADSTAPGSQAMTGETIDEIVVVGRLTTDRVTARDIASRQVLDLDEVFRQIPSVSVGGAVSIAQKIYVRGLEDSMLNVTVDGAPQHGTLFHHIGRVAMEPELLKTVDIQTGAGEATAGFGAIGGAIRFRTRDPGDLLEAGQHFGGLAKAGYYSNDGYKLSGSMYGRVWEEMGILASFVQRDSDDMQDGEGNTLAGTGARQRLGFLKFGGPLSERQRLSASYEFRDEQADFGQRPNWPVLEGDPLYPAEGQRETAVVNHGFNVSDRLELETTGYWTQSEFEQDIYDRWGRYGAKIRSVGVDVRANLLLGSHRSVIGVEYRDDHVASGYLESVDVWGDWAWDADVGRFIEEGDVLGVYAQDHWQILEPLLLSYGFRYDRYDLTQVTYDNGADSDGFSFNAGLEYRLTAHWTLLASFGEAFRGKEIGDAFTLEKRPGRISLSPTLEPERVDNFEGGVEYSYDGFRASVAYYNTVIDDVILDQLGNGPAPQDAVYYENVGEFRAEGVELKAGYSTGVFSVDAYFNHYESTLNDDRIEGYEQIGLGNSIGDNWGVTVGYQPTETLSFQASLLRFEDLNNIEVLQRSVEIGWIESTQFVDKPGYTVVDLFGTWRPFGNDRLSVHAAIYNLFDETYRAHASVADYSAIPDWETVAGVLEPGRDFRLGVSMQF